MEIPLNMDALDGVTRDWIQDEARRTVLEYNSTGYFAMVPCRAYKLEEDLRDGK